MHKYRHRSLPYRIVLWFLTWVTFALIGGVVIGTIIWFFANLFGWDLLFFTTVRYTIIAIAVIDLVTDLYKFGTEDFGRDKY